MLKWRLKEQLRVLPDRTKFVAKLYGLSIFFHVIVLLLLACSYRSNDVLSLTFNQYQHVPVCVMPLVKTVGNALQKTSISSETKNIPPSINRSIEKSTQLITAPKLTKKKNEPKKNHKALSKKDVTKKITKPMKKNTSKEVNNSKSKNSKKESIKPTPETSKISKPQPSAAEAVQKNEAIAETADAQEVLYVGREDAALIGIYKEIQEALESTWQVPVGIANHAPCIIKVMINKQGLIDDIMVEQTSTVLMYDMAARVAIANAEFPSATYGKTLVITFNE